MWVTDFFTEKDKIVEDACPVCKYNFGKSYLKTERIDFCEECRHLVIFHPYTEKPIMIKIKKESNLDKEFAARDVVRKLDFEDEPPKKDIPSEDDPRFPPWWPH